MEVYPGSENGVVQNLKVFLIVAAFGLALAAGNAADTPAVPSIPTPVAGTFVILPEIGSCPSKRLDGQNVYIIKGKVDGSGRLCLQSSVVPPMVADHSYQFQSGDIIAEVIAQTVFGGPRVRMVVDRGDGAVFHDGNIIDTEYPAANTGRWEFSGGPKEIVAKWTPGSPGGAKAPHPEVKNRPVFPQLKPEKVAIVPPTATTVPTATPRPTLTPIPSATPRPNTSSPSSPETGGGLPIPNLWGIFDTIGTALSGIRRAIPVGQ